MKRYGLIGYPLKNSFSVEFFAKKFKALSLHDYTYDNFPLSSIDELPALLERYRELQGFNVTIPYKQAVKAYLDELGPEAQAVGAVNCVKVLHQSDGRTTLRGFNTDVFGFETSLLSFIPSSHTQMKALVLGTGGSALAVAYVLQKLGIAYRFVSRTAKHGTTLYSDLDKALMQEHQLVVNCTPSGMFPKVNESPDIPYAFVTPNHYAFDLVYLPEETLFLQRCREQGARTKNGLGMLHLQAEKSWEIWNT